MNRCTTRIFDDSDRAITADHIYLEDDRPKRTGLLDANGLPIYRISRRQPGRISGRSDFRSAVNHKRGRARRSRAGCKLCKPWKMNGVRTESQEGERFSDHKRRIAPQQDETNERV